jgi:hypothetical protein
MKFVVKTSSESGLKVYGPPTNGDSSWCSRLLINGDRVVNGAWTVQWLDTEKNRGYAGPEHDRHVERVFEYLCHVENDGGEDYNDILFAYDESVSKAQVVVQP